MSKPRMYFELVWAIGTGIGLFFVPDTWARVALCLLWSNKQVDLLLARIKKGE